MKALKLGIICVLVVLSANSVYRFFSEPTKEELIEEYRREYDFSSNEGLDLKALTGLVKNIRSGQELERRLNEAGSINNLDLDGNQKVDYLSVSEFGDPKQKIGYSLTVEPAPNQVQEIASVTVEKNRDNAEIQVVGNSTIYGKDAIYNDSTPVERSSSASADGARVVNNYFGYRPLWISPFHFGYYPPYYSFFPIVSRTTYVTRVSKVSSTNTRRGMNSFQRNSGNKLVSPNKGKNASRGIVRSLKSPTSSQKLFQKRAKSGLRSGGFGQNRNSSSSNTLKSRSLSSNSRKSSSFGSSRSISNFKSSVRSSGFGNKKSAFGSSAFRSSSSRSFSFGGK